MIFKHAKKIKAKWGRKEIKRWYNQSGPIKCLMDQIFVPSLLDSKESNMYTMRESK